MGIVVITIPGDSKRAFVEALHEKTGAVDLVIVQKPKQVPLRTRLTRFLKRATKKNILSELWYGALLRLNPNARRALEYFREHGVVHRPRSRTPYPVITVDSVNHPDIIRRLKEYSPDLLVVWGSALLSPEVFRIARKAINLHMGRCPHYRGAIANQYAVFKGDVSHIGATIHYIANRMDAGNIIRVITPDITKPPRELFRDLNDRAFEEYVLIASALYGGLEYGGEAQDPTLGENVLLKQWTPRMRYRVAEQILEWERRHREDTARAVYEVSALEMGRGGSARVISPLSRGDLREAREQILD